MQSISIPQGAPPLFRKDFSAEIMEGVDYRRQRLQMVSFAGGKLARADFRGSDFTKVILIGADLGEGENTARGLPRFHDAPLKVIYTADQLRQCIESTPARFAENELPWLKQALTAAYQKLEQKSEVLQPLSDSAPCEVRKIQDNSAHRLGQIEQALYVLEHFLGNDGAISAGN